MNGRKLADKSGVNCSEFTSKLSTTFTHFTPDGVNE